jgi:hypothetical protein
MFLHRNGNGFIEEESLPICDHYCFEELDDEDEKAK